MRYEQQTIDGRWVADYSDGKPWDARAKRRDWLKKPDLAKEVKAALRRRPLPAGYLAPTKAEYKRWAKIQAAHPLEVPVTFYDGKIDKARLAVVQARGGLWALHPSKGWIGGRKPRKVRKAA